MPEKQFAFHDLPAASFPFTIELLTDAGEVVWSTTVTGPGAIEIPGLAAFYGRLAARVTTLADGASTTYAPPSP